MNSQRYHLMLTDAIALTIVTIDLLPLNSIDKLNLPMVCAA
jgi:hypothetical protein